MGSPFCEHLGRFWYKVQYLVRDRPRRAWRTQRVNRRADRRAQFRSAPVRSAPETRIPRRRDHLRCGTAGIPRVGRRGRLDQNGPRGARGIAADAQRNLDADRPVACAARTSMTGARIKMRQATTGGARLDEREATGRSASARSIGCFGRLRHRRCAIAVAEEARMSDPDLKPTPNRANVSLILLT